MAEPCTPSVPLSNFWTSGGILLKVLLFSDENFAEDSYSPPKINLDKLIL
jgi:hypothetical protein